MTTVLLWISYVSMGQNNVTDYKSVGAINNDKFQEQYHPNTTKSINPLEDTSNNNIVNTATKNIPVYNKKEWKKIKKQMQRSQNRVLKNKNSVYISKTIDTIYLDIPSSRAQSRLSEW